MALRSPRLMSCAGPLTAIRTSYCCSNCTAWLEPPPGIDVMAMLFGDAVNFSKLTEEEVPRFVQHFLGAVRDVLDRHEDTSVVRNTWGDGLYLVFRNVRDAGLFALEFQEKVATTNWYDLGLPKDLTVRRAAAPQ